MPRYSVSRSSKECGREGSDGSLGDAAPQGRGGPGRAGHAGAGGGVRLPDRRAAPAARRPGAHREHGVPGADPPGAGGVPGRPHRGLARRADPTLLSPDGRRSTALPPPGGGLEDGFPVPRRPTRRSVAMTTVASIRLTDSLQALIDARLDTVDRMLLGRVPRADRLAIARDLEAQIFDLLQECGADELGRDDVLAVL